MIDMKAKLLCLIGAALVAGSIIGAFQVFNRDVSFSANLESLTEEEDGLFGRRGHEVRECGITVIAWNGINTTCPYIMIKCNFWGNNGCTETLDCPDHGSPN